MRIVSWNCQGAYRKKLGLLDRWRPNLSVLAEVSRSDLAEPGLIADSIEQVWRECPGGKSLGVISHGLTRVKTLEGFESWPEGILPVVVEAPMHVTVVAIWTQMTKGEEHLRYVRSLHVMLDQHSDLLRSRPVILIGDFNSNTQWDAEHKRQSHSALVTRLSDLGIVSLYHERNGQPHGQETTPTFFLYRRRSQPFHIDFCFLTRGLLDRVRSFEIGAPEDWLPHSDHMPLFVELDPGQ